jgi:hypothetical protein
MKKLTYRFVKGFFKKNDCELLEKEYINAITKMTFKCHCGKISKLSFDKFRISLQCSDCGRKKPGDKLRFSYDYVYNYFLSEGCELLETEYINDATKMKYKCVCGNISYITFNNFKRNRRCKVCKNKYVSERLKLDYNEVYNYYKEYGCELLEEKYIGICNKMKFKCKCGNIDSMSFVSFKSGLHVCHNCAINIVANQRRYSYDFVKQYIESFNYNLLSKEYININDRLEIKCNNNHVYYSSFHSFKNSESRCPICNESKGEYKIHEYLINNNIKFDRQFKFNDCKNKYKLPFDFSVFDNDNLFCLIEYDGKQHYEPNNYFGGEDSFKYTQQNDQIKNNYCINNNIKLIRIPYWDYKNIDKVLNFELQNLKYDNLFEKVV